MALTYLLSFPVSGKDVARTLGSDSTWEILGELREAGLDGLTVEEISKKLDLPKSTVYGVLSKLQAAGWVESRRARKKLGRPDVKTEIEIRRTGRTKHIYVEKINWGGIEFESEFNEIIRDIISKALNGHQIVDAFADAIDRILTNLAKDEDGKKFLPSKEVCLKCQRSHEAVEFMWAVCIALIVQLLSDESDKLEPVLNRHNVKCFRVP